MIDGVRFHTITGLGRCPFVKQTAPLIFFGVTTWIRAGRFFSVYQSVQVRIHTLFPQIQVQVRTLFARSRQAPRMRGYLNELWLLMTHVAKINKVKGVGQQNQQNGLTKSAWIWVRTLVVRRISWKLLIFIIIRWFTDNLPPCCWGSLWSSPRAIRNSFGDRRARGNSPLWGIIWNRKLRWRFFHSCLLLDPTFSSYQMFICPLVQLGNHLVQNMENSPERGKTDMTSRIPCIFWC